MSMMDRFKGDELPDGTWGICKVHSPSSVVRLLGADGLPALGGMCEHCYAEAHDDKFFSCPTHGINPKAPGREGCPVGGCLGESPGPTEEEVAREVDALRRVWPGGVLARQDVVDEAPARPADERDREAGEGPATAPGDLLPHDPVRGNTRGNTTPAPQVVQASSGDPAAGWVDPFLIEEE